MDTMARLRKKTEKERNEPTHMSFQVISKGLRK